MKKPTDFQSVQPVLKFDTLLPALVLASPLPWHTGQSFPLIRIRVFHKHFSQGVEWEHFLCALSVFSVLPAAEKQLTGEEAFSLTWKQQPHRHQWRCQPSPLGFCQWPYNTLVIQLASIISPFFFFPLLQEFWGTGNGPAEEICQNPLWFHCAKCQWTLSA